jgi:hypothetical protein
MDGNTVATADPPPPVDADGTGAAACPDTDTQAAADRLLDAVEGTLGRLRALPLDGEGSDAALVGSVERLGRIERMVAAEQLRRIAAVDARGAHESVGAGSTATMLATRLGLTRGEARARTETATALEQLPLTAEQLAAGALGVGQAHTAAQALRDVTVAAGGDGEEIAWLAGELDRIVATEEDRSDRRRLAERLDVWAETNGHRTLADAEQRAWRRRRAWLAAPSGPDRMARLTADLPPVQAAKLRAALDPLLRKTSADDERSLEQRCADALVSLADQALDRGELPTTALQRPHVLLIATSDALDGKPGAEPATIDGHGPVSTATARQIVCDADVTDITIDADRRALDVGRTRRTPTRAQRAAVTARDQACVGCGAPTSRCELHHIAWWSHGGATDLDNLTLLCWDCHTHVHHHGWQIHRQPDGRYTTRPPRRQPPNGGPQSNGSASGESARHHRQQHRQRAGHDRADGDAHTPHPQRQRHTA